MTEKYWKELDKFLNEAFGWMPIPDEDDPDFEAKFNECLRDDAKRLAEMDKWKR